MNYSRLEMVAEAPPRTAAIARSSTTGIFVESVGVLVSEPMLEAAHDDFEPRHPAPPSAT
jgi:hypothetical protein